MATLRPLSMKVAVDAEAPDGVAATADLWFGIVTPSGMVPSNGNVAVALSDAERAVLDAVLARAVAAGIEAEGLSGLAPAPGAVA